MELTGKVALVTGASRGIGQAIAAGYAAAGAHVALAARDTGRLEAVAGEIRAQGGSCGVYPLDVTEPTAVIRTVDDIVEEHGRLDVLCNNAGIIDAGEVADVPPERLAAVHAMTLCLAREVRESGILVNSMSPGDIRTAMNPKAFTEAIEAVPTALWLASLPDDGPSGRFFRFMEEIPIVPVTDVDFSAGPG